MTESDDGPTGQRSRGPRGAGPPARVLDRPGAVAGLTRKLACQGWQTRPARASIGAPSGLAERLGAVRVMMSIAMTRRVAAALIAMLMVTNLVLAGEGVAVKTDWTEFQEQVAPTETQESWGIHLSHFRSRDQYLSQEGRRERRRRRAKPGDQAMGLGQGRGARAAREHLLCPLWREGRQGRADRGAGGLGRRRGCNCRSRSRYGGRQL